MKKRLRYWLWRFCRYVDRGREIMEAPGDYEDEIEQVRWRLKKLKKLQQLGK